MSESLHAYVAMEIPGDLAAPPSAKGRGGAASGSAADSPIRRKSGQPPAATREPRHEGLRPERPEWRNWNWPPSRCRGPTRESAESWNDETFRDFRGDLRDGRGPQAQEPVGRRAAGWREVLRRRRAPVQRSRSWLSPFRQTNRGSFWPSCATWWPSACRPKARSARGFQARGRSGREALRRQPGASLTERYEAERAAAEAEYAALRREVRGEVRGGARRHGGAIRTELREDALPASRPPRRAAEQERQDAQWEATTIAEAAKGGSGLELHDIQAELDARWQELQAIARQAVELLRRRGQWRHFPDPAFSGALLERHPAQRFIKALELAREQFRVLAAKKVPRFFTGFWPTMVVVRVPLGRCWSIRRAACWDGGNCSGWLGQRRRRLSPSFSLLFLWLHRLARRHSTQAYLPLRRTLLEAGVDRPAVLEAAKNDCRRLHAAIAARHNAEIKKAEERFTAALTDMTRPRSRSCRQADETYQPRAWRPWLPSATRPWPRRTPSIRR